MAEHDRHDHPEPDDPEGAERRGPADDEGFVPSDPADGRGAGPAADAPRPARDPLALETWRRVAEQRDLRRAEGADATSWTGGRTAAERADAERVGDERAGVERAGVERAGDDVAGDGPAGAAAADGEGTHETVQTDRSPAPSPSSGSGGPWAAPPEQGGPEPAARLHEVLLGLAGRVDDDALASVRELVAVEDDAGAAELLGGCLLAEGIGVTPEARSVLGAWFAATRVDHDLLAAVPITASASAVPLHRFVAEVAGAPPGPDAGARAVAGAVARLPGVTAVGQCWRLTPAGRAAGPLPHRVVLVRTDATADREHVAHHIAHAARDLGAVSVEVLGGGEAPTVYHRDALAVAVPLLPPGSAGGHDAGRGDPEPGDAGRGDPEPGEAGSGEADATGPPGAPDADPRASEHPDDERWRTVAEAAPHSGLVSTADLLLADLPTAQRPPARDQDAVASSGADARADDPVRAAAGSGTTDTLGRADGEPDVDDPVGERATDEDPTDDASTDEDPTDDASTDEDPTDDASTDEDPTDDASTDEDPTYDGPADAGPMDPGPMDPDEAARRIAELWSTPTSGGASDPAEGTARAADPPAADRPDGEPPEGPGGSPPALPARQEPPVEEHGRVPRVRRPREPEAAAEVPAEPDDPSTSDVDTRPLVSVLGARPPAADPAAEWDAPAGRPGITGDDRAPADPPIGVGTRADVGPGVPVQPINGHHHGPANGTALPAPEGADADAQADADADAQTGPVALGPDVPPADAPPADADTDAADADTDAADTDTDAADTADTADPEAATDSTAQLSDRERELLARLHAELAARERGDGVDPFGPPPGPPGAEGRPPTNGHGLPRRPPNDET